MTQPTVGAAAANETPTPALALYQTLTAHQASSAAHVAAKLGIADHVAAGVRDHLALAAATGTHPPYLLRLLRLLVSTGILAEPAPDTFELTPMGRHLRTDVPDSLHSMAMFLAGPGNQHRWSGLAECVLEGRSAFSKSGAADPFAQIPPQMLELLRKAMVFFATYTAEAVAQAFDFGRAGTVVDVGGGQGLVLEAILRSAPQARGILFDLPDMVTTAGERIAAVGLAGRCEAVGGDFFASVPTGGDVYLLNNVIHDWDDEHSIAILANCRKAMGPEGVLLLVEGVYPARVDASVTSQIATRGDVNMMINTGAAERSEEDFRRLLAAAGFTLTRVRPIRPQWSGVHSSSLVEAACE
jgi:C-methyltransferase